MGECGFSMLNSSQPTGRRKRKPKRVVESDNDSEYEQQAVKVEASYEGTIKMEDSTTVEEQSIKFEALQDQIIKAEASPGPTSPNKQAGRRKAITRTPRKNATKSPDKFNPQEEVHEDGTAEAKGKNKDSDEGRPAKRPRLPSMRKNASTTAVSTPIGGNTPTVEKSMPAVVGSSTTVPSRQIVDGPVSNEIDMRDGKAFSSLLKKVGDHTAGHSSSLMNRRPRPSKVRLDTTLPLPRRWSSRKQSSLS
jgi:hypothetical protein